MTDPSGAARAEIAALIYRYCELFDTGRFDEFALLFAHGTWHKAGPGDRIRNWIDTNVRTYDGSPRTQHATSNLVIEVDDAADSATASSYVTVHQAVAGFPLQPILCARYRDRFVRVDGRWRWLERVVTGDLYGDVSHHVRY